jgi:hypothetical protein
MTRRDALPNRTPNGADVDSHTAGVYFSLAQAAV